MLTFQKAGTPSTESDDDDIVMISFEEFYKHKTDMEPQLLKRAVRAVEVLEVRTWFSMTYSQSLTPVF